MATDSAATATESGSTLRELLVTFIGIVAMGVLAGLVRPVIEEMPIVESLVTGVAAGLIVGIVFLILMIPPSR